MSGPVTFEKYCDDPVGHKDAVPEQTRKNWDPLCKARSQIKTQQENIWKQIGGGFETAGNFTGQALYGAIIGIYSPQLWEYIGIFEGAKISIKLALNTFLRFLAKGYGVEIGEAVAKASSGIFFDSPALLLDSTVTATILREAIDETVERAIGITIAETIAESTSVIFTIAAIVQVLGAVLDAWDPEGFDKLFDGDQIQDLSNDFNAQFITGILNNLSVIKSSSGVPIQIKSWPIEYTFDHIIKADLCGKTKDYWTQRNLIYNHNYLNSLKYNSNGHPINWKMAGNRMHTTSQEFFNSQVYALNNVISDGNAVVATWLTKWWPVVLIILIAIIVVLFTLR